MFKKREKNSGDCDNANNMMDMHDVKEKEVCYPSEMRKYIKQKRRSINNKEVLKYKNYFDRTEIT